MILRSYLITTSIACSAYALSQQILSIEHPLSDGRRSLLSVFLLAKTLPYSGRDTRFRSRRHVGKMDFQSRLHSILMDDSVKNPFEMRTKELKEELDALGVAWKGKAFEQEGLAQLLVEARMKPPEPSASPAEEPGVNVKIKKNVESADDVTTGASNGTPGNMFDNMDFESLQKLYGGNIMNSDFMQNTMREAMKNPQVMQLMDKMKANPKVRQLAQEYSANPDMTALVSRYKDDPEMLEFVKEFQSAMGGGIGGMPGMR